MKLVSIVTLVVIIYTTSAVVVPNVHLRTGRDMPAIGLGTWQIKGGPLIQAVKDAIEIGYRHIDTAQLYANEKDVGEGLHAQIKAGIVKREDVFITTKVCPGGPYCTNGSGSNRLKALETIKHSLQQMNVSYVDLVLVHWPEGDYSDIYRGLEDAYEQNLVHSIGVSDFNETHIDHLLKTAKVKPAVNQIEVHPTMNQDETVEYCAKLNISVTGYSPLGHGNLTSHPTLIAIGKKHNKTASQVALRWQIQRGLVVIPKSTHKAYIKEDFEVFDFELTADEMKTIHKME